MDGYSNPPPSSSLPSWCCFAFLFFLFLLRFASLIFSMTLVDDDVVILCESNSVDIIDIVNINKRVCLNRCGCDGILLIVLSLGHFFIAITLPHLSEQSKYLRGGDWAGNNFPLGAVLTYAVCRYIYFKCNPFIGGIPKLARLSH